MKSKSLNHEPVFMYGVLEHLSLSMLIIVYHDKNTFAGLEFFNYLTKKNVLKFFEKVKNCLSSSEIQTHDKQIRC